MRYHVYPSQRRRPRITVSMGQDPELATILNGNEHGFAIYEYPDGTLVRGPVTTGTWNAVSISIPDMPGAELEALWHTHPGGVPSPSSRDMSEARRVGADWVFITQPEMGVTRYYPV